MDLLKKYGPHILIVFSVWIVYGGTLSHQYAGDDVIVIQDNERVQAGWNDIPSLFENIKSEQTQHRYGYRPITLLTFATEVEFFGLDPFWSHFFNLVFYTILCLLVFHLLSRLFPKSTPVWILLVTMIFTVHPLHAEVVANIKSRDEILAMIFGSLYLIQIVKWCIRPDWKSISLASLFALLGFLSKENAIGYILVGFIVPILYNEGLGRQVLKQAAPSFLSIGLLVGTYVLYIFFIQENSVELYDMGLYHEDRFVANPLVEHSLFNRILNAFFIVLIALKLFVLPHPLVHDYGYHSIELISSIIDWRWMLGFIILVILGMVGFQFRKQRPQLLFGLMFFLLTLAIYLHVPIPGPDFFGERFLFGPLLGLAIILITLLSMILHKLSLWIAVPAVIVFAGLTFERAKAWESTESLFEADKELLDNCARFNFNYANLLHHKYYDASASEQAILKEQFFFHYERTLEITDRILPAYLDLGSAYMEFEKPKLALPVFEECVEKYSHLSAPFFQLGQYFISQGRYAAALQNFQKALEKGKSNPNIYYMKAVCEIKLGDLEAAKRTLNSGRNFAENMTEYRNLMTQLGMN